jgi:rubredoxin
MRGSEMRCPRCKRFHNILEYIPLMQIEEFERDTTPVYKCPACKWVFAPAEPLLVSSAPLFDVSAEAIAS